MLFDQLDRLEAKPQAPIYSKSTPNVHEQTSRVVKAIIIQASLGSNFEGLME